MDNKNDIGMKQSWKTCFNLIKFIQIDTLELTLSNEKIESLILLAHLKLFKKCPWALNYELDINHLFICLSNVYLDKIWVFIYNIMVRKPAVASINQRRTEIPNYFVSKDIKIFMQSVHHNFSKLVGLRNLSNHYITIVKYIFFIQVG
jgi:hypothetical protein